jgi:hypothetical protein
MRVRTLRLGLDDLPEQGHCFFDVSLGKQFFRRLQLRLRCKTEFCSKHQSDNDYEITPE